MTKNFDYSKESVLIVDDDVHLREGFKEMLLVRGFNAHSAGNGQEALDMLDHKDVTFLITDMKMPGMDGMELIRKVCADYPEICIIAITGHAAGYKYVDVINAGANDFIKKPFDGEELEAKIRRAINERNLRRELSRLSITDSLTGLYNQRHFYARLKDEMVRSRRQGLPLALILLDLDNFKTFNDTYGHLAGDEALKTAGTLINQSIRQGVDSAYRYGGDEFSVILVGADLAVADEIVKRISESFQNQGKIRASVGYAVLPKGMAMDITEFVDLVDKKLYEDKVKRRCK